MIKNNGLNRLLSPDKRDYHSQIPVSSEPLDLGPGVTVNDIGLVVLETPGDHDEDIPLADPDFLLDLALYPSHPGDPVEASYPDVICAHHQFCDRKHLPVPLLWQSDPDDLLGLIVI